MDQVVSFPKLGLDFSLDRVAFYLPEFLGSALGGRPVYWYGVLIAIGYLVAMIYITKRAHVFGINSDRAFDVIFAASIIGIIGARLYYVAFSWDDYKDNLASIIRTDEGGLAIYGGILIGLLTMFIACRVRKVKFLPMVDLSVAGVILAQAIGRWGNFFNVEVFGGNTNLPWGMTSAGIQAYLKLNQSKLAEIGMIVDPMQPVHPTFLYESIWCLLGFALIVYMTKKRKFDGQLTLIYFAWYGLGRFFIEGLRTDSLMAGNFRVSQILALACFVLSIGTMLFILHKIKKSGRPENSWLYVDTEESKLAVSGELYKKNKDKNSESKTDVDNESEKPKADSEVFDDKQKPEEDALGERDTD